MLANMAMQSPMQAAHIPQQMDALVSMSNRMSSLEDIIRQQEQVISATLQRMKELEGVVGAQSRLLEQAQQHISVLSDDRNTSSDTGEKLQAYVQRQSDQINALQAYVQEQMATVHGLDTKYDAVTRGIEQKVQSDVAGFVQRVNGLEVSTTEAIRALQGTLQQQMASIQTADGRSREEIQQMQKDLQAYLTTMRQQEHQLENTMREALRDVHTNVSNEIREYVAQLQGALKDAVVERNDALASLNQRITDEIAGINYNGTAEISNLRSRVDDVEGSLREGLRTAYAGLAAELANVAQHSQGVDNRQKLSHQSILQELSKHDAQMETIDVNWRASVVDLNAKLDEQLGRIQGDQRTAAQNFQHQIAGVQDRFAATVDAINAQINDLAQRIHERCIVAIESIRLDATKQAERFVKLQDENASTQEYLKKFAADVDRNASQFRQIVEVAIRTAHSDLLDRINAVTAAVASHHDPAEVQQLINNAMSKIWGEVNSGFTTQRDLNGLQSQLASLESAVRQEICALADRDSDILRRIDQIEIPMRVLELPTGEIIMLPRAGKGESPQQVNNSDAGRGKTTEDIGDQIPARDLLNEASAFAKAAEKSAFDAREFVDEVRRIQEELAQLARERAEADAEAARLKELERQAAEEANKNSPHSSDQSAALPEHRSSEEEEEEEGNDGGVERSNSVRHRERHRKRRGEGESEVQSEEEERRGQNAGYGTEDEETEEKSPASGRNSGRSSSRNTKKARDERRERYEQRRAEESMDPLYNNSSRSSKKKAGTSPTHSAYVLKKEYNNYKDFSKEEIDALWIEVMDLNRRKYVTREELKAQMSNMKKQLLHHVMNVFHNQESELLGMLSGIKLQLRQITDNPALMTDVALFRAPNGMVDFDRVVEHLNSPQGSQRRTSRGGPARYDPENPPPTTDVFGERRRSSKAYRLAPLRDDDGNGKQRSRHYSSSKPHPSSPQRDDSAEDVYYVEPESPQQHRRPASSDDAESRDRGSGNEYPSTQGRNLDSRRPPRPHEMARVPSDGHPYALTPTYSNGSN